jgi:hypothetical protein
MSWSAQNCSCVWPLCSKRANSSRHSCSLRRIQHRLVNVVDPVITFPSHGCARRWGQDNETRHEGNDGLKWPLTVRWPKRHGTGPNQGDGSFDVWHPGHERRLVDAIAAVAARPPTPASCNTTSPEPGQGLLSLIADKTPSSRPRKHPNPPYSHASANQKRQGYP